MPAPHPRPPLAALAAAAAALLLAPGTVAPQHRPETFRGGPTHPGVESTRGVDSLGSVAWRFHTAGPVRSSPAISADRVYVGSTDGYLYALDLVTGEERWRYRADGPVGGSPAVVGGRVVFGDRTNAVHAVDAATGARLWRVRTGADLPLAWGHEGWDYLLPSATPAGDTILVGSGDGHLYALDLATGREHWRFRTGGRVRATPAVADGVAYVGAGDGVVYGVRVADGAAVWRFTTAGAELDAADFGFDRRQIQGSAALVDGVLLVGSRDASLYAVELRTRETRWRAEDGSAWVVASPAVAGGRVYSARSSSARVRALDAATGEEVWAVQTGGLVFSSPVVVGRTVYVGSGDGSLYALAAADGTERWRFRTGGMVISTPAVRDGTLVFGSDDGWVYALRSGRPPRRAVLWDDALTERSAVGGDPAHRAVVDHLARAGYEVVDLDGVRAFLAAPSAADERSVLVVAQDGVPDDLLEGGAASPVRRYLAGGGKVVWLGYPPGLLVRDPDSGGITGVDRSLATRATGVDHSGWDSDRYGVTVTPAGRARGLARGWVGSPALGADPPGVVVLARDELGRPAAWEGPAVEPGGGRWLFVPLATELPRRDELRWVADYGVFYRVP